MQGYAFKSAAVAAVIFSVVHCDSPAFATQSMQADSGDYQMTAGSAGCMGCHQGETVAVNDKPEQSREPRRAADQEQPSTEEAAGHDVVSG